MAQRIHRREALRVGFLGGIGLGLADYLALADNEPRRRTADAVIFVHLQGGPSHLDTLDMKPEGPVAERGEFQPIQSRIPGLVVCEHLPLLARAIDQFTLIRGISHASGAHPQANQYLFTGNPVSPAVTHPAYGAVAVLERPSARDLPGFVAIPMSEMTPGYLGVAYGPFKTGAVPRSGQPFEVRGLTLGQGVTEEMLRNRNALLRDLDQRMRRADTGSPTLQGLDRFGQQANDMILSARTREAFDVAREDPAITRLFAANDAGQSCLLAARLVAFGARFVTINLDAWDTHLDNFNSLKNRLLPPFDAAITALVQALKDKGLLERTLVVASGEFGRTPTINPNAGRDHWPRAMWTLMTGGGVRPGQLIGGSDNKGHGPDNGTHLKPDDLAASIYHALGLDHRKEYYTRAGRPVTLVPHGNAIRGLFG